MIVEGSDPEAGTPPPLDTRVLVGSKADVIVPEEGTPGFAFTPALLGTIDSVDVVPSIVDVSVVGVLVVIAGGNTSGVPVSV